jgi:type IV pilus secretin PilQ/predicted competence protein
MNRRLAILILFECPSMLRYLINQKRRPGVCGEQRGRLAQPLAVMALCALVVFWLLQPMVGVVFADEHSKGQAVILETMRVARQKGYSRVVLQLNAKALFEEPIVQGDAIVIRLKNVATELVSFREYPGINSWVSLEKEREDLNVRIGLPENFQELKYLIYERPHRLVLNLCLKTPYDLPSPDQAGKVDGKAPSPQGEEHSAIESEEASGTEGLPTPAVKEETKRKVLSKVSAINPPETIPKIGIQPTDNRLISINYIDVDIRKALSTLAMERELNIATAAGVSGKISVHLYQVTMGQALTAIVNAGGFTYHKQGDVYYVYKPKEARDPQALRLQLRVFKLKYGEVAKVQEILDALPETRVVKVHEATKTIVVEDTPENIEKIEAIIRFWDKKPKQVMIEAKILEVSLTDQMLLGVNWEKILGDVRFGTGGLSRATLPTTTGVTPVPSSGMGIFGNVISSAGSAHQFAAALDALRTKTKVNTLSTPKIMAVHGETARVQVGGQRGYRETTLTSTGMAAETIKFIPTGTILEITPFVDEENNVLLNVKPSIKSVDIQEGIPVVTTTEVSTWLLAKNGETVFIGGLIQSTKSNTKNMIPCLGNIPGAGALFGKTDQQDTKKELVVLITPLIFDAESKRASQQAIEKTRNIEEKSKKEPQPDHKRLFEFLFPPREGVGK